MVATIVALNNGMLMTQSAPAQAAEMTCDRSCLISVLQDYLDAVISNQPGDAPLAANYRGTENTFEITPGRGMWSSSTAIGAMEHYYGDPVNQSAAFYGLINEGSDQAIVSIRLKIDEREVSEAEWVIARAGESLVNFEGVVANQPIKQTLSRSEWTSREDMIFAANAYFDALAEADRKPDYYVPSVEGCPRIENGTMVTGGGPVAAGEEAVEFERGDCTSGLERMTQINGVNFRIFPVVDQEAGVVMGRGVFSRPPALLAVMAVSGHATT